MKTLLRWFLWLWISIVILAAFFWAPISQGFAGLDGQSPESSRTVFFHVPIAITSFLGFMAAGVWSILYLMRRQPRHDHAGHAAVEVSLVFCVLATLTGAIWSKVQWGAYWNWDPRQTSIALALVFYGAYLSLRGAVEDPDARARLCAAYSSLGLAVAPFLFFIMPRMASFSLHPKPASAEFEPKIGLVILAAIVGYTCLFFWIHSLRRQSLEIGAMQESEI